MIVFIRQDLATQVPKSKHNSLDAAEGNKWREDLADRLPAVGPSQLRAGGTLPRLAISSPVALPGRRGADAGSAPKTDTQENRPGAGPHALDRQRWNRVLQQGVDLTPRPDRDRCHHA